MVQEKIVKLRNTVNPEYQKNIHAKTKEILQNQEEISINDLRNNCIFQSMIKTNDTNLQDNLWEKIKSIAGEKIDKTELKTILILLDSHLETVEGYPTEKFVMDNNYELNQKCGIFMAEPGEINAILKTEPLFDFDNDKITHFPKMTDGKIEIFDRNMNKVDEKSL